MTTTSRGMRRTTTMTRSSSSVSCCPMPACMQCHTPTSAVRLRHGAADELLSAHKSPESPVQGADGAAAKRPRRAAAADDEEEDDDEDDE
jgi:hypothetical protein